MGTPGTVDPGASQALSLSRPRGRADDRDALEGILYVIRTGIGRNRLPTALFDASGATCWRQLTEWHEAGAWQQLHERLLTELRAAGLLDLSAALVDSTHLRALKRGPHGPQPGRPSPTRFQAPPDHRPHRHPARRHTDRGPTATTSPNCSRQSTPCHRSVGWSEGHGTGRAGSTPTVATTTTSTAACPAPAEITPVIARRGVKHGTGLGTARRPAERTFASLTGLPTTPSPHRTQSRRSPGHPESGLLDHLPAQTHSELMT